MTKKIGIAGVGAIGSAVARSLTEGDGIPGFMLECTSDPTPQAEFGVPNVSFKELSERSDLVIECLPAHIVPELADEVFAAQKDVIFISSAALLIYPQIVDNFKRSITRSKNKVYIPSGALCGLDGVKAMREMGIVSSKIASTKPPLGFDGAPHIMENNIDLTAITVKTMLFEGSALEASKGFPANINVAATLSLAGIGPEKTRVEIWADPDVSSNAHEITVQGEYSTLTSRIENMPDPTNPKSSVLAAQSIVVALKDMNSSIIIS